MVRSPSQSNTQKRTTLKRRHRKTEGIVRSEKIESTHDTLRGQLMTGTMPANVARLFSHNKASRKWSQQEDTRPARSSAGSV